MTVPPQQVLRVPSHIAARGLTQDSKKFLFLVMLLSAMAAGMGWGIRGQYGHETGAMIAGTLAALTLVMLFIPQASSLAAARAAAMMTVAIGIGGSMTYGQTVGLTHDQELLGNWEALRWGMTGLLIKGGLWIGFAGVFLGMGLGGKRYGPFEMAGVILVLVGLMFLGIWLINSPFDPTNKRLPLIYFSDHWYFEPERELQPRMEIWGGYLLALVGLICYVRCVRHDRLAFRMALVGMLAGGLGFTGGQAVQAFYRWNPEVFTNGVLSVLSDYFRYFNWWNMMETIFGAIWGAVIAMGLWFNRRWIEVDSFDNRIDISLPVELLFCAMHCGLLFTAEFAELPAAFSLLGEYAEFGLILSMLPLIGIVGGRLWPYLMLLTIVIAPISGKTVRTASYANEIVSRSMGWLVLVGIPLALSLGVAIWLIYRSSRRQATHRFAAVGLLVTSWLFFGLNTVVFDYAWPWKEWTFRTPNQLVFVICTILLTITAFIWSWPNQEDHDALL